MEGEKRVYNDRFLYADPLAKSSSSRSTRYRLSRKGKVGESELPVCSSACMTSTAGVMHDGDMCDYGSLGTSNDSLENKKSERDVESVHGEETSGLECEVDVVHIKLNTMELQIIYFS